MEAAPPDLSALLTRAQRGDAESFCALCRLHETRLLRQALQLCGDVMLAEDLAQETLLAAWKSMRRFNARCQFFTWLCAILLNRYRTVLRQKRPIALSALNYSEGEGARRRLENFADEIPSPSELTAQAEHTAFVRRCLDSLPPKQREVIHLRFYVNDSLEGIAAALNCSTGTVKSRLYHALEKLRRMKTMQPGREDADAFL